MSISVDVSITTSFRRVAMAIFFVSKGKVLATRSRALTISPLADLKIFEENFSQEFSSLFQIEHTPKSKTIP